MPEEEVPTIGIIYPPPEVRSILFDDNIIITYIYFIFTTKLSFHNIPVIYLSNSYSSLLFIQDYQFYYGSSVPINILEYL